MELLIRRHAVLLMMVQVILSCTRSVEEISVDMEGILSTPCRITESYRRPLPEDVLHAYLLCDSIVVCHNDYQNGAPVLGLSSIRDTSITWHGRYGLEDGMMMNSLSSRNGNRVLLYDFVKKGITVMDLSSGIERPDTYSYNTALKSQCIIPVSHENGIFLNPDSFKGKERRIRRTEDGFLYNGGRSRFNAFNVVLGGLAYSPRNGTVIYADRVEPTVEILDSGGRLSRRIMFKDTTSDEPQQYSMDKDDGMDSYSFLGKVKQSFTDVCCTDNNVALLFRPGIITPTSTSVSDMSYVIVMDWDGDNMKVLHLDEDVVNISLSSDGKSLFSFSSGEDGNYLTQYDI